MNIAYDKDGTHYGALQKTAQKLSRASVSKNTQAYEIAWDAPEYRVERGDPRFEISHSHALAQTDWYQQLTPCQRSDFGLGWSAQILKHGIMFESALCRGMFEYAIRLPDGAPEFRYALHEIIEECNHSLMFQEFINRSGARPRPFSEVEHWFDRRGIQNARRNPALFFACVLAGETFIDHENRKDLRRPNPWHPLLERIIRVHITEEARHVRFAEVFLEQELPRLRGFKRFQVSVVWPLILSESERLMMRPTTNLVRDFKIPRSAMEHAFGPSSDHRRKVRAIVEPMRELAVRYGLMNPVAAWIWRRLLLRD